MPYADPQKNKECQARWRAENPDRVRELNCAGMRRWRGRNPEKDRENWRAYQKDNRDEINSRVQTNRAARVEEFRKKEREYVRNRAVADPGFKLLRLYRVRVYSAMKGLKKSAKTKELVGCSVSEFQSHIEKQFRPGMTWENYGPIWHVDHIKPCALFDLMDPVQQRACFHYSNLQPLFAGENLKKGDKY